MVHRSQAELEEERSLILAAQRDRAAFAPLYERYADQIFSYALTMTKDRDLAEEITAATFARAIEELPRFEWRGVPYSAWLYRVAGNLVHRTRRRRPTLELQPHHADTAPGPEEVTEAAGRAAEVRDAVSQLPDDQRQAVVLHFGGGLRNREIGEIMGRSEGAVKLLTFRALTTLRLRLGAPLPAERGVAARSAAARGPAPSPGSPRDIRPAAVARRQPPAAPRVRDGAEAAAVAGGARR
ncbi:MAG TPA: sigma-70 family RNA polymerase sigma factor [Candidatus Dormibacteraeota bacterium]|nr:sigma-70 family RNA polymerase sigma factor [Candidatus Dormibacteraeota bacterium]